VHAKGEEGVLQTEYVGVVWFQHLPLLPPACVGWLHKEKKVSEIGGMMGIAAVIAWGIGSSKDDNKKWSPLTMNETGFPKGTPFKSRPWKGSQNLKVNVINRYVSKFLLILFLYCRLHALLHLLPY